MKEILVGHTGFVGGNLAASHNFDGLFNSKNIGEAFGSRPELLVYAGVRAEMFLANKFPEQDLASINAAADNIRRIAPRRLVLISTISVYDNPVGANELSPINAERLSPYGRNRLRLERLARELCPEALIVRLPALYGRGLKKNFIFDMINFIPALLTEAKYAELSALDREIATSYEPRGDGFMRLKALGEAERRRLRACFERAGFSALSFTDSRSQYQFYPLARLWGDIGKALSAGIATLNAATEPVLAGELFRHIAGKAFVNETRHDFPRQDFRTLHAALLGGRGHYLADKRAVMDSIKTFVMSRKP